MRYKLFFTYFILFFNLCCAIVYSQQDTASGFEYDYCLFRSDDSRIIIEFYYSFSQQRLLFVKTDNGFEADGHIILSITDITGNNNIFDKEFKVPVTVKDTAGYDKNTSLSGQINILIDSGNYKMNVSAEDFNSKYRFINDTENFKLIRFPDTKVLTSSIQLASSLKKSNDQSNIFYKNTFEVVPNPSRIFGNNISILYYYFEVYNLKKDLITDNYSVIVSINDIDGKEIKSISRNYKLKNESKSEIGQFEINDIKTNVYDFKVAITDSGQNKIVEEKKRFYIYNSGIAVINENSTDDNSYLQSDIAGYSKEQLMKEFEESSYIMTDLVKENFRKLNNVDLQKKYFFNFWKALNPDKTKPYNVFKKEYFERVKYANKNFKYQGMPGWRTDRGRVYCLYGKPSEIEKHPFESTTRAYEIWTYDVIQGGVEFDFVDLTGDGGQFVLANSTAKNELSDVNWQRKISTK